MTTDILDISSLKPKEREIRLNHPSTGEPLPIWLTIMSADDPRLKVHQRRLIDSRRQKQARGKDFSAEQMETELVKMLAHAIVDWKFEVHYNGEFPAFSVKKASEMLADPNIPWFFEQVNTEVGDTKAFF